MPEEITVKFKRLSEEFNNIPVPSYSTEGSAGMDIRAAMKEPIALNPMEVEMIPTNLSVEIPGGLSSSKKWFSCKAWNRDFKLTRDYRFGLQG